jgi:plasmid stabilization system protein ParE
VRLRYTRRAIGHLKAIRRFSTERFGHAVTEAAMAKLEASISDLCHRPDRGRPGRIGGTRELVVPGLPFITAYRVSRDTIDILAILHAARPWPKSLD